MTNVDPSLVDVFFKDHDGYPDDKARDDTREALMAAAEGTGATVNTTFPKSLWVEPTRWTELAEYNTANKLWGINFLDRFTNQSPTHECTCHSLTTAGTSCYNKQRSIALGPPVANKRLEVSEAAFSVWLSPLSVYSEANPGQWGGAGVRQVLRIAALRGILPEPIQPREYNFKHTLHGTTGKGSINQARGNWVSVEDFPNGWQDTAKRFKPLEFVFPETIEEIVSLLLNGYMVCVGRNGHAIPYGQYMPAERYFPYPDSYDVIRFDSWNTARNTPSGSFAIISMTAPDDWSNPAGNPVVAA